VIVAFNVILSQARKACSTDAGVTGPPQVTLTITDGTGATATVSSATGSQPPLSIRLFTWGF